MYVSIIADGTRVSTFLCTQKLGPEEVSAVAYPEVGMGGSRPNQLENQNVKVK